MGDILQSCDCKMNFCEKYAIDKTETSNKKDNEDENEEYVDFFDEDERIKIIEKETEKCFSFPADIKNMKLRANLIREHKTDPWSLYKELDDLGFGSYGVVKKVCLKSNPDMIRVIKIIRKAQLIQNIDNNKLLDEIIILKNLDHPNIMKLYEFFEDKKCLFAF